MISIGEPALEQALEGIKVIELAQLAAVPMAGRLLGDFGAEVIHVEHPVRGDVLRVILAGVEATKDAPNYVWENYNRNKKAITLDVSTKKGQQVLYSLIKGADVFLTNMRPFEREKFNIDYSDLNAINPRLIYGSITGTGKGGSEQNEPGYDQTGYWAKSGLAHSTMPQNEPPDCRVGAFGDNVTGLSLAFGISTALLAREKTGRGQEVDSSLLQAGIFQISWSVAETLATNVEREQTLRRDKPNVLMSTYRTKDKRWFMLTLLQPDRYWSVLCKALRRPDLEDDTRFADFQSRLENRGILMDTLDEIFATATLIEWQDRMAGIPTAPIQNLHEVCTDQQVRDDNMITSMTLNSGKQMDVVAPLVHLSDTPGSVRHAGPEFGQHTEEILLDLGFNWAELETMKVSGVI